MVKNYCVTLLLISSVCMTAMYNNTAYNSAAVVPYAMDPLRYSSLEKPLVSGNLSVYSHATVKGNRKQRRAAGSRSIQLTSDQKVEYISKVIHNSLAAHEGAFYNHTVRFISSALGLSPINVEDTCLALKDLRVNKTFSSLNVQEIEKLRSHNSYFNDCLQHLIDKKIEQYEAISGATIDATLDFESAFSDMTATIRGHIKQHFMSYFKAKFFTEDSLWDSSFLHPLLSETNSILYAQWVPGNVKDIIKNPLIMSSDYRYLKGTDDDGKVVVWDLVDAKIMQNSSFIRWDKNTIQENGYSSSKSNNVGFGALDNSQDTLHRVALGGDIRLCGDGDNFSIKLDEWKSVVIMRPTVISRLCQKAFLNNWNNAQELKMLLNSKHLHSIKGFPKENFIKLIRKQIKGLERQNKQK